MQRTPSTEAQLNPATARVSPPLRHHALRSGGDYMNETALKERLKIVAKEKDVLFNVIWKQLLLERFLARLSSSEHHDHFIFEGMDFPATKRDLVDYATDAELARSA